MRIPRRTLARVLWRCLFLQAAWNRRGMQNLGFAYAIDPALRALYPEPERRREALRRHLCFFNCHPYTAAAIAGAAVLAGRGLGTGVTPAVALLEAGDARGAIRENLYGLLLPFGVAALLAPAAAAAAGALVPLALRAAPGAAAPLAGGFWALAGFAAAAGARAVRGERSRRMFLGALLAGALLWACLLAWGWLA